MSDVNLIVLVDKDKKDDIDGIAERLTKAGMKIDRKMSITGVISGSASAKTIEALKGVDGVRQLREEEVFSLPPMDEDTPQ